MRLIDLGVAVMLIMLSTFGGISNIFALRLITINNTISHYPLAKEHLVAILQISTKFHTIGRKSDRGCQSFLHYISFFGDFKKSFVSIVSHLCPCVYNIVPAQAGGGAAQKGYRAVI